MLPLPWEKDRPKKELWYSACETWFPPPKEPPKEEKKEPEAVVDADEYVAWYKEHWDDDMMWKG